MTEEQPFWSWQLCRCSFRQTLSLAEPLVWNDVRRQWETVKQLKFPLLLMGFLGMWICGALVYLALKYTSATNGTLIYTSSPVMIILIELFVRGRRVIWRERIGITMAFLGVLVIVAKGLMSNLTGLQFNAGDLIFVVTAFSWALYSVGLKSERFQAFSTATLFFLIAMCGSILLFPFALVETLYFQRFPSSLDAWINIAGIVAIASLLAFSLFQYGVKILGPSMAGIFLYLLPIYGVSLAILFLGETLATYHLWGVLLVLGGVVLATVPSKVFRRS